MVRQRWTRRALIRYTLLQLPEIAVVIAGLFLIQEWVTLPSWLFWLVLSLWVLKEIVLFPLLWRAYDPKAPSPVLSFIGRTAVARDRLDPQGYVWLGAELWRAEVEDGREPVESGARVLIIGVHGITLQVRPEYGNARRKERP